MADKAWKDFERQCAALFGGERHWANSGERMDFESDWAVGQSKLVKVLSLEKLTQLAEEMATEAEADYDGAYRKIGVVCTKVRRGRGRLSPMLVTMTGEQFAKLLRLMPRVPRGHGPQWVGTEAHTEPV